MYVREEKEVRAIRDQDFLEQIKQYEKLIFSICFSFTKNYFDAEDIAQETFLTAFRKIDTFDGNNFKAWITTIAANKCKDYLKSPARTISTLSDEELDLLNDGAAEVETEVIRKEEEQQVYRLCTRLKEPYQSIAVQYFCQDKKLSQIAKETGKNLKTLQTQLYRAKKLLGVLWKEEYCEEHV